jgi:type II secretory pathway pseudopilin PulG
MKKSFTLFELVVVVIIVGLLYSFAIRAFNFNNTTTQTLTLKNLKQFLISKNFTDTISLKCSLTDNKCFLYIDNKLQTNNVKLLNLDTNLEVYAYDDTFKQIYFQPIKPKALKSYDILFELTINKDNKHKDLIVKNFDKYYIFNSIYLQPIEVDNPRDYFDNLTQEAKYAF